MKPHKGRIIVKDKIFTDTGKYAYVGVFLDHPRFAGRLGRTSLVVKEFSAPDGSIEIETLNSRYTIIKDD